MPDTVLVVDDDPGAIRLMAQILHGLCEVRFATCGDDALRMARADVPSLILLDADMPGMSGFDVCCAFRADPLLVDVPVIFVSSHTAPAFEVAGFELGAVDFIAKPVSPPLVQARVRTQLRLRHMADELRRISLVDALTGLSNRRAFDAALQREWSRAHRGASTLSLLMIDVDHFKLYNDHYGHPAGDVALKQVAGAMARTCRRPTDVVARYGGEEFALLLPDTSQAGAWELAQRLQAAVERLAIAHAASPTRGHLTLSIGTTSFMGQLANGGQGSRDESRTPAASVAAGTDELVSTCDQALYAAKSGGRAQCRWRELPGSQDREATSYAPAVGQAVG